jgi:hypothetical protein
MRHIQNIQKTLLQMQEVVLWTSTGLGLFRFDYWGLQPEWVVT